MTMKDHSHGHTREGKENTLLDRRDIINNTLMNLWKS